MERERIVHKENSPTFKILNPKILILILLLILAMVVCINDFSAATNIYVNGTSGNDSNNGLTPATAKLTIGNATKTVDAGGTVHIADGIYKGPKNRGITINKNMSIIGQSQNGTIIDAEKQNRIFTIIKGVTVTLKNLTLTNGDVKNANGGAIWNEGTLTVNSSTFKGNIAHNTFIGGSNGNGGAIASSGKLTVTGSTFTGNSACNDAGIGSSDGEDNSGGGAIVNNHGTSLVTDSTFNGNTADVNGGAIVNNRGTMTVSSSTFTGNIANDGGGAIVNGDGTMTVKGSKFTNNRATGKNGNGGAIVNGHGTLKVTGSTFNGNTANTGAGAILNGFGKLTVTASTFNANTANQNGGALINGGLYIIVTGSIFKGNTAHVGGGAILNGGGTLKVSGTTFNGNTARQNGGAILNTGVTLTVINSTFTKNTAGGKGGAIYNEFHETAPEGVGDADSTNGKFTVTGSNFTYNTASSGGAIYNNAGTGKLHFNRIIQNVKKDVVSPQERVDARYNWWGSNRNPSDRVSGNVIVVPWLVATITARPGGSFIITVSLLNDSYGNYHDPQLGHVPDGISVTFQATNGTVNPGLSHMVNGRTTSIFTATTPGKAIISAKVDNQVLSIVIPTPKPTPTPNTVPMQKTGAPFYMLFMALLAIGGGLLMSGKYHHRYPLNSQ